jgi:hypothetical protein
LKSRLQKLVLELVDGGIRLNQAEREFEKEASG